ncbi:hemocyte protein-glutamine gamma-glutamyltransferase-like [Cimex lectularius]|uniref:Transglutaminase-like domain-containing protein n=1 Tax=Cimex lectularius TaxID=79782 RepID=A0A8I6RXD8_CIMLE|nr:hemocyte protein-glutamine gamma-glutamyltransferase-like [Cimex lectularius]
MYPGVMRPGNRSANQRNYLNNMRNNVTSNYLKKRNVQGNAAVERDVAQVTLVELYLADNAKVHNTERFEISNESLVLRRGQPFYLAVRFDKEFDPNSDTLRFVMDFGPTPHVTKGTRSVMVIDSQRTETKSQPGRWDAVISHQNGADITVQMEAPSNCQVGIWHMSIETGSHYDEQALNEHKVEDDIYMLLNPWNQDDSVFMKDDAERMEYVLNDVGKVWMGSYRQPQGRRWLFGQFEDAVLPCVMYLLELSDLPHEDRGSPVLLARAISAVINAADEGGLVIGRWDGDYSDGTSPHAWTGSAPIMEEFLKTGATPVSYAQCWVFAGLVTTVCRALGLPCRPTTNYVSAHDTNSSLTVDKFFDYRGEEIIGGPDGECHDSCWNFHVWNDVWMSRPDLPPGYGGWQIIDATPQEMSGNMMRCGPASVEAVRCGQIGFLYDNPFVFSEINADVCHFKADTKSYWGFTRTRINRYHVGRKIVTKRVDVDDDVGDSDMWDVTQLYKNPEGSKEERMAVFNAVRGVDRAQLHYDFPDESQQDVSFDLEDIDQIQFGEPFSIVVKIKNNSTEVRTIEMMLAANSVYYTGMTVHRLKRANGQFKLRPNSDDTLKLKVFTSDYIDKLVDHSLIKIHAIANVLETKQTWSEEDDFPLIKPSLKIDVGGQLVVGEPCTATFSFTNPLDKPLTNCSISVEGPGLQWAKIVKCENVEPKGHFAYTESFHPRRPGQKKLVAVFSSNQLNDVANSTTIVVQSP